MKVSTALVCAMLLHTCLSSRRSFSPSLDLMSLNMKVVSQMSPAELELLAEGLAAEELIRTKRSGIEGGGSGSGDILKAISSGISKKIGFLGAASSGASSFIHSASGAFKGGDPHGGYSYGHGHVEKPKGGDFFALKSSILGTLFQAIKAITGGVTILKGQLIKGGGLLASAAGGLISKKGEVVSNLGKKIVNSAKIIEHKPAPAHISYGPPLPEHSYIPSGYGHMTSYGAPSAPAAHYGVPASLHSAPSAAGIYDTNKFTQHFEAGSGKALSGYHAGLILLKPLESQHDQHDHHTAHDHHTSPSVEYPPPAHGGFVTNAFEALKDVLKSVTISSSPKSPATHAPEHGTGYDIKDNVLYPPPPLPSAHGDDSYKPLQSDAYGNPSISGFDNLGFGPAAPGYDAYKKAGTVSNAGAAHPISMTGYKINKIQSNINKIIQDRSSESIQQIDPYQLHKLMEINQSEMKSNKESRNMKDEIEDRPTQSPILTKKNSAEESEEPMKAEESVMYILRGNRIVKLQRS